MPPGLTVGTSKSRQIPANKGPLKFDCDEFLGYISTPCEGGYGTVKCTSDLLRLIAVIGERDG